MKRITARFADRLNSVGEAAYRFFEYAMTPRFIGFQYAAAVCAGYFLRYFVIQRCTDCKLFSEFASAVFPLVARLESIGAEFTWTGAYVALLWILFLPFHLTFPLAILFVSQNKRSWGPQRVDKKFIPQAVFVILAPLMVAAMFFYVPDLIWGTNRQSSGLLPLIGSDGEAIWVVPVLVFSSSFMVALSLCGVVIFFQAIFDFLFRRLHNG
jgi:hypothetical protein